MRRARADLKREVIKLVVEKARSQGIRWAAVIDELNKQSSVPVDHAQFAEIIRELEEESIVRVMGERERRIIKSLGVY